MNTPVLDLLLLTVLGAIIGSFLSVLVGRLPEGRTVIFGRSTCDNCFRPLAARDLVPLLTWLWLRGRCRHCHARIAISHPLIELGAILIAIWAATVMNGWLLAASCVLGWTLLAIAFIDGRHYRIPDVLTLPLLLAGLAATYLIDLGRVFDHAAGAAIGFAAFAGVAASYRYLRRREGMGMGDAKLLAALGAWVSYDGLPTVVLLAAGLAIFAVLIRSLGGASLRLGDRVPFGPFLAATGWIVWLYGPLDFG